MGNDIIKTFVGNKFRNEGEDHIRISPFASTTLGKILSPDWRKKFFIPHVGEFLTPQCFANWLITGDDEARHDVNLRPSTHVREYSGFVLYSKFYQLCSMKTLLQKEKKDLPFAMYKVHTSGVKEFHRWKEYPIEIREMLDHVLDPARGPKADYPWEEKHPGLLAKIQSHIAAIAENSAPNNAGTKPKTSPAPATGSADPSSDK